MQSHVIERSLASILVFQIECLREVGEALVDPRARRGERRVSELVGGGKPAIWHQCSLAE